MPPPNSRTTASRTTTPRWSERRVMADKAGPTKYRVRDGGFSLVGGDRAMQIVRNAQKTNAGPSDWFTGAVFIDAVASPSGSSRVSASSVHFTPGARTAWHTHPNGQTIFVIEGIGLAQRRGGPIEG